MYCLYVALWWTYDLSKVYPASAQGLLDMGTNNPERKKQVQKMDIILFLVSRLNLCRINKEKTALLLILGIYKCLLMHTDCLCKKNLNEVILNTCVCVLLTEQDF